MASATAVAEMIFRYLNSRCAAAGGTMTAADIEAARVHLAQSLPNAYNFFDAINQRCMDAAGATAPTFFSKDNVLASLLFTCAHRAARSAFPNQITRFGATWLNQFFGGFAEYVRQHVCTTADDRLIRAYAAAGARHGAKLAVTDLLKEPMTLEVLHECFAPFNLSEAPAAFAAKLSDVASTHIASCRGIPKPDISKVTEQEVRNFLTWLPPQVHVALHAAGAATGAPPAAAAPHAAAAAR